jgi:hypothetical protein
MACDNCIDNDHAVGLIGGSDKADIELLANDDGGPVGAHDEYVDHCQQSTFKPHSPQSRRAPTHSLSPGT